MQPQIKELKRIILEAENPVGHIRMETTDTNPADFLGFGEWVLWGSGKVPVGIDTTDTDFNEVEKTGGEKEHKLTIDEMPAHSHKIDFNGEDLSSQIAVDVGRAGNFGAPIQTIEGYHYANASMRSTGNNIPHNNLQPYITCYMWKRIK